jgi:hypothetical protein
MYANIFDFDLIRIRFIFITSSTPLKLDCLKRYYRQGFFESRIISMNFQDYPVVPLWYLEESLNLYTSVVSEESPMGLNRVA